MARQSVSAGKKNGANGRSLVPAERIERRIPFIRGHRVMLDADLALLYGVTTTRLNEQVKRNLERFPPDFMFQLDRQEFAVLMSQSATSKKRGGRTKLPYVFTAHGAIMAASVLNTAICRLVIAIQQLMQPLEAPAKGRIGFQVKPMQSAGDAPKSWSGKRRR